MAEAPTSRYCANPFIPANGLFNITATYKKDSDIVLSNAPKYRPRDRAAIGRDYAANKSKLAFWYMSDCSDWAAGRSEYVQALQRYIPIDIFGACVTRFPESSTPCPKSMDDSMDKCFLRHSRLYKFYLSFENAICKDYITEKLFKVLQPEADVVPIVLGASIEQYSAVAPPNSFIHVKNFSSPKKLAAYLQYLDGHDDAYNAYHSWRERFVMERLPGRNSIDQHPTSQLVQLCHLAHHPPPPRVWTNLTTWFSIEDNCRLVEDVCEEYGICNRFLGFF